MRAADEAEFRDYMAARWPALVRIAYLLSGDQHTAEDLAQTALEKVASAWGEAQTAAILGCSVGTVRSQAHKALNKLRVSPLLHESIPHRIERAEEGRV